MNLYVRYFDHDTLATNMDEVASFLSTLRDVKVNNDMFNRIEAFVHSDNVFPFRLKVSYSNYILFLKTDAKDLVEFKYREKQRKQQQSENRMTMAEKKRSQLQMLSQEQEGWYVASVMFKRVIMNPETGKCQYVDTKFRARLKAQSALDCYNRVIQHLKNRQDVDPRSQFPSVKSNNFHYEYIGTEIGQPATEKPAEEAASEEDVNANVATSPANETGNQYAESAQTSPAEGTNAYTDDAQ